MDRRGVASIAVVGVLVLAAVMLSGASAARTGMVSTQTQQQNLSGSASATAAGRSSTFAATTDPITKTGGSDIYQYSVQNGNDGGSVTGTNRGTFDDTYYWVERESDYNGTANVSLIGPNGGTIATVPYRFKERLCMEGSGMLDGGQIVNWYGEQTPGTYCKNKDVNVRFDVLNATAYPWGAGSHDNPLTPLRSIAVDPGVLDYHQVVYIPQYDGVYAPRNDGIGGFTHDGCFRADDVGGGITGQHIDVYAGPKTEWTPLENAVPTHSGVTLVTNTSKCSYLTYAPNGSGSAGSSGTGTTSTTTTTTPTTTTTTAPTTTTKTTPTTTTTTAPTTTTKTTPTTTTETTGNTCGPI